MRRDAHVTLKSLILSKWNFLDVVVNKVPILSQEIQQILQQEYSSHDT